MNNEQLAALCADWQRRLRLQDWDVTVLMVPVGDMDSCSHCGNIKYYLNTKEAKVSLLDPAHYCGLGKYDIEVTLVHELLHCHFAPFAARDGSSKDSAQEQAIDAIAKALVGAVREVK